MEKLRPTYDLKAIKQSCDSVDRFSITISALRSASMLGFDRSDIVETIRAITPKMFNKSMTTYADHRVWQDVYHVPKGDFVLT